jgi:hypothetical protein
MQESSSFTNFCRAFTAEWFTLMSSGLSVPLAMAAVYVDNPPLKIGLGLLAIVCFVFASFRIWKSERLKVIALKADAGRTKLEVRYDHTPKYNFVPVEYLEKWFFRIGVYNRGDICAENVKVWLRSATKPRCLTRNKFPYRVALDGSEWGSDRNRPYLIEILDISINPHEEELFIPIDAWRSGENKIVLDKIDTAPKGEGYRWTIEIDEKLELDYEVTSATANSIEFRISIEVKGGIPIVERTS